MLCQLCAGLDLGAIMRLKLDLHSSISQTLDTSWSEFEASDDVIAFTVRDYDSTDYENSLVPYHETLENLYSASEECDLCRALLHSASGMIKLRNAVDGFQPRSGKNLFLSGISKSQGIQLLVLESVGRYALLGGVGFSVDDCSALRSIIHGRTIPKSPQSKDSLRTIQRWLTACSTRHGHLTSYKLKPSRLLRYDWKKEKISICSSFPSDIKYAALSHCWGSVQPLTLNTNTKYQLEEGLPLQSFPETFQDAFWVIQQLDIPYIWIDSLCIIQDSNKDWVHESARMCDVYGSAYLTIAATRAKDCSEGFLKPREGPDYTYLPFYVEGIYGNVAMFPMPLKRVNPWKGIIDLEEEPLSKRAWALQERYLSPRTLHFASTQMYFECGSSFHTQDQHLEPKSSEPDFKIHRRETARENSKHTDTWEGIVRRYTERYLTVESDKLPAIGGLAARVFIQQGFNNSPGDEYLAGLWRKNLLSDLTWQTFVEDIKRSTPTSYTAPSWSWASVNEPVAIMGDQDTQSLAVVKDARVHLENPESPFGKVTGGWVHLSGIKLHPCEVEDKYDDLYFGEGDATFRVFAHMDSTRFDMPEVRLADYVDKKSELVAVPLSLYSEVIEPDYDIDDPVPGAHFLLLMSSTSGKGPIEGLPCFRRVGFGSSTRVGPDVEDVDGRRWLRDRCMEAMEQGNLEDIIIV